MTIPQLDHLKTGAWVLTHDRKRIGSIKDVQGSYFKVDAPLHRDFWLAGSLIETAGDEGVLLTVSGERISDFQLSEPGPQTTPGPESHVGPQADLQGPQYGARSESHDEKQDPAPQTLDDPMAAIAGTPVLGPEELLEQRARMERELAQQSRTLTPDEPSVTQQRGARAWERIPPDHTGFGDLAGQYVPNAVVQDRIADELATTRRAASRRRTGLRLAAAGAIIVLAAAFALTRRRRRARNRAERLGEGLRDAVDGAQEKTRALIARAA